MSPTDFPAIAPRLCRASRWATIFCSLLLFAAKRAQAQSTVFGPRQVITTRAEVAITVFAADLDGDGDFDVLAALEVDGKIAWYENLTPAPPLNRARTSRMLYD